MAMNAILFIFLIVSYKCNAGLLDGILTGAHDVATSVLGGLTQGANFNIQGHIGAFGQRKPQHPERPGDMVTVVVVEQQPEGNQHRPGHGFRPQNPNEYGSYNNNNHYGGHNRPVSRPGHGNPHQNNQSPGYGNGNNGYGNGNNGYGNGNNGYGNGNNDYGNYNGQRPPNGYGNGNRPNNGYGNGNFHGHRPNNGYGNGDFNGNQPNNGYGNGDFNGNQPNNDYGNNNLNGNGLNNGYGNGGNKPTYGNVNNNEIPNQPPSERPNPPSNHGHTTAHPMKENTPTYGSIYNPSTENNYNQHSSNDHNEKTTKKPTNDGPLLIPLNPNEYVYGGDKVDVTAPKRETDDKQTKPAGDDEDFPIDIRFKDE